MLNLIFDGDDTLWENNVLFERAIEAFIDYLAHPTLSRSEVRAALDEIELSNTRAYGYGVEVFERSLAECLVRLRDGEPGEDREKELELLRRLCHPIRERAGTVELLPGVVQTLEALRGRHRLALLTKGDPTEGAHLDDRQFTEVGRVAGAGRGSRGGADPPRADLVPGAA